MNKIEMHGVAKAYGKNAPVIENLDLAIKEGSFTVLLGPSGCGKSTILRMIAGLEQETAGEVMIDGRNVKHVEPGDRHIAMVFQNYALYPTMTVRGNIEFGLKNMKVPKEERERRIQEITAMVGLEQFLDRKPQHLSGGQRQRVALARAIVKKPAVFLMDEPLSNLDAKLRAQIRTDLIELYRKLNTTFVYVTHDQVEAMSMGTDIVLLEDGKIRQQDAPSVLYNQPRNLFAAKFIGAPPMNILPREAPLGVARPPETAYVGFRPEKTRILGGVSEHTPHARLHGDLVARELLGDQVLYKINTRFGIVNAKSDNENAVDYGPCTLLVEPEHLTFFDESEQVIDPFAVQKELSA